MKKIISFLLIVIGAFFMTSCSFFLNTTSNLEESTITPTIDFDQLKEDVYQDVYNEIYNELFEKIKNEITSEISREEINQIYLRVKEDILQKIENGEIEMEALSVIDKMITTGLTSANAVVGINNLDSKDKVTSIGSGVIYKKEGRKYYVVTNHHVIEGASKIQIDLGDDTIITAEKLGQEKLVDVAILSFVSEKEYQVAGFGDSSKLQKGEFITAVGNPTSFAYYNTMTMGIVSGINRYFDIDNDGTRDMFVNYIQHDAAINAGNSGGALFNLEGEIIGINTLKIVDYTIEGMGFAIPGNLVKRIADDIEEFGFSRIKPMLGITFVDISANRQALINDGVVIPESITNGFYVQSVVEGSSVSGYVLPEDIILKIGDVEIIDTNKFVEGFSQYIIGDLVDIVVYRNGSTITLENIELKGRE